MKILTFNCHLGTCGIAFDLASELKANSLISDSTVVEWENEIQNSNDNPDTVVEWFKENSPWHDMVDNLIPLSSNNVYTQGDFDQTSVGLMDIEE